MALPRTAREKVRRLRQRADRARTPVRRLAALGRLARTLKTVASAEAEPILRELLDESGKQQLPALRSSAACDLAELSLSRGDTTGAERYIETAFEGARAARSSRREALAWNARGMLFLSRAEYRNAGECFDRCLASARLAGDVLVQRVGLINRANVAAEQGRNMEAVDCYRECLLLDEGSTDPLTRAISVYNLGWALMRAGRWEEAAENLYRTIESAEEHGFLRLRLNAANCLGSLFLKRNQLDKAVRQYRYIVSTEQSSPRYLVTLVTALGNLGRALHRQGNLAASRRSFAQALEYCDRTEMPNHRAGVLLGMAELALAEHRHDDARACLDEARGLVGDPPPPLDAGEISRVEALLEAEIDNPERTRQCFKEAARLFSKVGDGYELARLRLQWGRWLTTSGDFITAGPLLESASSTLRRLAIMPEAEQANRLLFEIKLKVDRESALLEGLTGLSALGLDPSAFFERALAMCSDALHCRNGAVLVGPRFVALVGRPDLRRARALMEHSETAATSECTAVLIAGVEGARGIIYLEHPDPETPRLSRRTLDRIALFATEPVSQLARLPFLFGPGQVRIPGLNFRGLIGTNPVAIANLKVVSRAARTDMPVLIRGESGTGKELIARSVHDSGPRRDRPFVPVNCSAVPEGLLEAEFFGVEKGAATGVTRRKGKFEQADTGTVFLDEVGDMSPGLQAGLLRVLQDGSFHRVGGTQPVQVDVRVVAATNKDLEELMRQGHFRTDLYFRLNACEIMLPPLRERREDIPDLVRLFIASSNQEFGRAVKGANADCLSCLSAHSWPGNIRELKHVIEQCVLLTRRNVLTPEDLPRRIRRTRVELEHERFGEQREARRRARLKSASEIERQLVIDSLEKTGWQVSQAAELAGYSRAQFYRLMRKHDIPGARAQRNGPRE